MGSHTLPSLRLPVVLCRLELPRIQSPSTHNHAIAPLQQVADSYFHYFSGYSGKSLNTYFHTIQSRSRSFSLSFWGQKINSLLSDRMFTITLKTNAWLGRTWNQNMHQEKKIIHGNFFSFFVQKNVTRIRFQEIKIRPWKGFEKMRVLCFYIIEV